MSEKYEFSGILINGASTIKILLPKIARIALEFEKKNFSAVVAYEIKSPPNSTSFIALSHSRP